MLNSIPKVSIIMPSYNRAGFIGETIESVLTQTFRDWELVIVDDGSTDNTEEVVNRFRDQRITFYKAGRIGFNGKIKNMGLAKVRADLIAFLDSDDLWEETKLEKQVAGLASHPEAMFSLTGGYNFKKRNQPIDFFYKQREGFICDYIFTAIFQSKISTTTPSLLIRKECLEKAAGFDETKPFSDIDFILTLAKNFKALVLYEPLLFRRLHDNNDSGAHWIGGYQLGIDMIRRYRSELPGGVVRSALFRLFVNFGDDAAFRGQTKLSLRNYFKAWLNNPWQSASMKKSLKAIFLRLIRYQSAGHKQVIAKPWKKDSPLRRILAIRLQAMGDVTITLPYLQHLRKSLPDTVQIDLLTRQEYASIPKGLVLFNRVITFKGGRSLKAQLLNAAMLLPTLSLRRYDVVIDLQNNEITALICRCIRPRAWSVFDKFSSVPAGERTRRTIEAVQLGDNKSLSSFQFKKPMHPEGILLEAGWDKKSDLVVLNPAGAFPTRNWPLDNYIAFARIWLQKYPNTQFLLLGTSSIQERADYLERALPGKIVVVVNKTNPAEAFAIMQQVKFVLSEDSGLMHMAWVSGIPVFVIFGSTRSDWSRPLGTRSAFVDSSDLPCGNCMQVECIYHDNHCLTRWTPEFIFQKSQPLLHSMANQQDAYEK